MTAPAAFRQWPTLTKVREAELIKAIVKHLDRSQWKAISSRCEELRQDFRTRLTFEYDPDTDPTAKRDALIKIGKLGPKFAKAVASDALVDQDWLPAPESNYEFTVQGRRMAKDPRLAKDRQFRLTYGSIELATMAWAVSELAKEAADKLRPGTHRKPEKDLTASFAFMLVVEFPPPLGNKPRRIATTTDDTWREKRLEPKAGDEIVHDRAAIAAANREYNEENWTRLPARYQKAYRVLLREQNRWRRRRGQPPGLGPIPLAPTTNAIRRRRRRKEFLAPSSSPDGPFRSIAPVLFKYFTGRKPDRGLERSCRNLLKSLRPDRRRARANIGQTAL